MWVKYVWRRVQGGGGGSWYLKIETTGCQNTSKKYAFWVLNFSFQRKKQALSSRKAFAIFKVTPANGRHNCHNLSLHGHMLLPKSTLEEVSLYHKRYLNYMYIKRIFKVLINKNCHTDSTQTALIVKSFGIFRMLN